jgi:hypothetical protein
MLTRLHVCRSCLLILFSLGGGAGLSANRALLAPSGSRHGAACGADPPSPIAAAGRGWSTPPPPKGGGGGVGLLHSWQMQWRQWGIFAPLTNAAMPREGLTFPRGLRRRQGGGPPEPKECGHGGEGLTLLVNCGGSACWGPLERI